jgi:hypothetical protein
MLVLTSPNIHAVQGGDEAQHRRWTFYEAVNLDGLVKSQIRSLREHFWDSFFAPLNRKNSG